MVTGLSLGTIKTYGNLSSYSYLHLPQHLCKMFDITPSVTIFAASYRDGRLILEQIKEDKDAALVGNNFTKS